MPRRQRTQPTSIYDDFRATRRSGIRTAFLATLLISGVVPALTMAWNSDSTLPSGMYFRQLGTIMLSTYPLTISIALIVLFKEQGWVRWGSWLFAAAVIATSATIGNFVGDVTGTQTVQAANLIQTDHPLWVVPAAGANYFAGFYATYGMRTFLAAIIVGIFAGKTASRFVRHVPRNTREAAELAMDVAEQSTKGRAA